MPSLIKFGQVVLEKMMEILKVYRQMDKQQATGKAHFSAGKVNFIKCLLANLYKRLPEILVKGWVCDRWDNFLTFRKRYVVMEYVFTIYQRIKRFTLRHLIYVHMRYKALCSVSIHP